MKFNWIKSWRRCRKTILVFTPYLILIFCLTNAYVAGNEDSPSSKVRREDGEVTEIVPDPVRTLLLASTLDGSLTAFGRLSGRVRWVSKDVPMIKVPGANSENNTLRPPHFLPDPRSGSLYLLGGQGKLKKLPFTIPQLVSMAPCRSSEGLLYSGRKMDHWLSLDPLTGDKEEIVAFGDTTCPATDSSKSSSANDGTAKSSNRNVLLGKSEYTISMVDGSKKWNVSFSDYSSVDMEPQRLLDYELVHFTTPSTGTLLTYDKSSGELLWEAHLETPIIALYTIDSKLNTLVSIPFTTIASETLDKIKSPQVSKDNSKLLPTLYVGECPYGLYAVSSLVDDTIRTITDKTTIPLLEGPPQLLEDVPLFDVTENKTGGISANESWSALLFGHYEVPEALSPPIKQIGSSNTKEVPIPNPLTSTNGSGSVIIPIDPVPVTSENQPQTTEKPIFPPFPKTNPHSTPNKFPPPRRPKSEKDKPYLILTTVAITIVVTTSISTLGFFTVRKFQWKRHSYPKKFLSGANGIVTVGKIQYDSTSVLGKGCEGTFVYKGKFESRDVAVKRILPECFEFADREVDLLKESDQHPNVIRYFCTESDGQFRYIALELCSATICDWIEGKFVHDGLRAINVLREATDGLAYLHSLRIVHRDVKPANVLLSVCSNTNAVRATISDFGLCKKLSTGRVSFSRRSGGIPGTEGWIAPEMLKNSGRTTYAVDVFSLGCVYYYVLSNGEHPFGDVFRRQSNISIGQYAIGHNRVSECPQGATELIERMLSFDPSVRPPLQAIQTHPMFWSSDKVLGFFLDVSDRIEKEEEGNCLVLRRLENEAHLVISNDWRESICDEVKNDLRKYRTYKGNSVRDLLRALRNKKNHYRELTEAAQKSLGQIPDEFVNYWITKFPNLLPYTWKKFEILKDEPIFSRYYPPSYYWKIGDEEIFSTLSASTDDNWRSSISSSPIRSSEGLSTTQNPEQSRGARGKQDKNNWRGGKHGKYSPRWRKSNGPNPPNGILQYLNGNNTDNSPKIPSSLTPSPTRRIQHVTEENNGASWRNKVQVNN